MAFWLDGLMAWLAAQPDTGAFAMALPSYRPHLGEALAARLRGEFFDFRLRHMQPLGWEAAKLPLSAITDAARAALPEGGALVLQNSEALLSVSGSEARRAWFGDFLSEPWRGRVILPLMLYSGDWPEPGRLYAVPAEDMPQESLLERLANLQ